jgi:ElaB/YqjD/DUF883 family membrane-anchored ribosome-binding protein
VPGAGRRALSAEAFVTVLAINSHDRISRGKTFDKPMIHVVLDTNAFTADCRRESGPFRALVRLRKGEKVKLHVPYVVKNEFVSQQKKEGRRLLKDLRNLAHELHSVTLDEVISSFAEDTKGTAHELRGKAGDLLQQEWEQWLKDVGANEYPIDSSHGALVMEDYFAGKPPFKAVKNREDIPDGFIFQTIIDLAKKYHPLHVVANDNAMRTAAAGINGIVTHDKLAAFIVNVPAVFCRGRHGNSRTPFIPK